MKKLFLLLTVTAMCFATAWSAIDNFGRIRLAEKMERPATRGEEQKYFSMILEISDSEVIDSLAQLGALFFNRRENMVLACVPTHLLPDLEKIDGLMNVALSRKVSAALDYALPATRATDAIAGTGLPQAYSGKGVVVGFSDLGFDPGHAAFEKRVRTIMHFDDTLATVSRAVTEKEIEAWTTDMPEEFHATHVAGILAGADRSMPYQGVARDADIVATTSVLQDVGILAGVEEIIGYAKKTGQPAVINLSLGANLGPHDGTDLFCRYLDLCAEDAAILLAAGNYGASRIHAAKTLTAADNVISVMVESCAWTDIMSHYGYVDAWSSLPDACELRFRIYDRYTGEIPFTTEWIQPTSSPYFSIDSQSSPELAEFFTGGIIAASELSGLNNRYNLTMAINLRSTTYYPEQAWSRYSPVVDIRTSEGAHIEMFSEGDIAFYARSTSYPWATGGDSEVSVSSIACGHNTVCVGASATRSSTPLIGGGVQGWQDYVTPGNVCSFSSYGTTADGRSLPHFCAPGAYVVSAFNRHFIEKYPELKSAMAAESPEHPGHYYFTEAGTSMAAPHAAGIFALWLEADPTLTASELRDIAIRTARRYGAHSADPRWGAGLIDALAGLEYILGLQGINDAASDIVSVRREGDRLVIEGCSDPLATVEVYSISGNLIFRGTASDARLPRSPVIVRLLIDGRYIVKKLI